MSNEIYNLQIEIYNFKYSKQVSLLHTYIQLNDKEINASETLKKAWLGFLTPPPSPLQWVSFLGDVGLLTLSPTSYIASWQLRSMYVFSSYFSWKDLPCLNRDHVKRSRARIVHLHVKVFGTSVVCGLGQVVYAGDPTSLAHDSILYVKFNILWCPKSALHHFFH